MLFSPGWWARPDSATQGWVARRGPPDSTTYTLWLSQPTGSHCWRLAQSTSALSSPAWSPDGLKIAYLRWGTSADGKNHCEVLVQRGFDEPKTLASCKLSSTSATPAGLESEAKRLGLATSAMAPAWSPRGTFLAVPWLDPPGTAVIRASDGQLMAHYANAFLASWSPDESHLAMVLPGDREGYHVTTANLGPPAAAIATKHAAQAAIWESTGQAFYAIAWQDQPNPGAMTSYNAELVRYDIRTQRVESVRRVISRTPPAGDDPSLLYFARIPGSPSLLAITSRGGQTTDILEMSFERQAAARRHTWLDPDLVLGAPSIGPDKDTVALRFGPHQNLGVPAIVSLRNGELRAIVPDHATQVLATQTIIERLLHVFDVSTPRDIRNPTFGAVRMPSPAMATAYALRDGRVADRIEKLTRFGLNLLAMQPEGNPTPGQFRAIVESKMFLTYISADYTAALRAADTLEPQLDSPRDRLALTIVRAQCRLGQRKWSEARELLTLLSQKAGKSPKDDGPDLAGDQKLFSKTIQELLEELAQSEK